MPKDARYLYVAKDRDSVFYVRGEPTNADFDRVANGLVEIIRLADGCYWKAGGGWTTPEVSALTMMYGIGGPPVNVARRSLLDSSVEDAARTSAWAQPR